MFEQFSSRILIYRSSITVVISILLQMDRRRWRSACKIDNRHIRDFKIVTRFKRSRFEIHKMLKSHRIIAHTANNSNYMYVLQSSYNILAYAHENEIKNARYTILPRHVQIHYCSHLEILFSHRNHLRWISEVDT